jgi:predicted lipid carrier protein YhbT
MELRPPRLKHPDQGLLRRIAPLVARLPQRPPALLLATALNIALRPSLGDAHKILLQDRVVLIGVLDAGIECRIRWHGERFMACAATTAHDVAIRARARDFHTLALRQADPDTLFFQSRLLIEGDNALGLGIKNLLDSIETPHWLVRLHRLLGGQAPSGPRSDTQRG